MFDPMIDAWTLEKIDPQTSNSQTTDRDEVYAFVQDLRFQLLFQVFISCGIFPAIVSDSGPASSCKSLLVSYPHDPKTISSKAAATNF
jgi:hypothetical protein